MDDSLTYEALTQNLNTKFHVAAGEAGPLDLELAEISDLKQVKNQEEFAVVFRGPLDRFLDQGTRSFDHEQLGQFELFIVPIKQDDKGYYYEAIFNRFRE